MLNYLLEDVTNSKRLGKKLNISKRRSLKAYTASVVAWHTPVIASLALPAHAQTSMPASSIVASSLDANNPFARFVLIVDSNDNVLANCGASGGNATANNLSAGTYSVFADSNGSQNQIIDITAAGSTQRINVPTSTGACDFLVATVELPSGVITPASGQQLSEPWSCSTNQNTGCN